HLELGLRAGVQAGLRLLQRGAGLIEGGLRNGDEPLAEQRVVVRLRDVEPELRTGSHERLLGARAPEACQLLLHTDAAARVEALRERQRGAPGVGAAERQILEAAPVARAVAGSVAEVDVVEHALELVGERTVVRRGGRELRPLSRT